MKIRLQFLSLSLSPVCYYILHIFYDWMKELTPFLFRRLKKNGRLDDNN